MKSPIAGAKRVNAGAPPSRLFLLRKQVRRKSTGFVPSRRISTHPGAQHAKELGVGNPTEETCRRSDYA